MTNKYETTYVCNKETVESILNQQKKDKQMNENEIKTTELYSECKSKIIEYFQDYNIGTFLCDLHNELFNMDYWVVGIYRAKQELEKFGIFEAIEIIKDYENENFGEVNTDFSSTESAANMLAYIVGEQVLNELETVRDNWDNVLTKEICLLALIELEEIELEENDLEFLKNELEAGYSVENIKENLIDSEWYDAKELEFVSVDSVYNQLEKL